MAVRCWPAANFDVFKSPDLIGDLFHVAWLVHQWKQLPISPQKVVNCRKFLFVHGFKWWCVDGLMFLLLVYCITDLPEGTQKAPATAHQQFFLSAHHHLNP